MTQLSRRRFITTVARGTASIAILGVAACSSEPDAGTTSTAAPSTTTIAPPESSTTAPTTTATPTTSTTTAAGATAWERTNLGIVSAYILERGREAALVDTGTGGSEGDIAEALGRLGLTWANLGHVILTHSHRDHVGSIDAVMAAAPDASAYIGEGDAAAVSTERPLISVNDGDKVFDLEIIGSPGHTPGSISVFDPVGRILVAGDALQGGPEPGSVIGANPRFTADLVTADQSVVKLAGLLPDTILPGHGEPVTDDAAAKLTAFAASI